MSSTGHPEPFFHHYLPFRGHGKKGKNIIIVQCRTEGCPTDYCLSHHATGGIRRNEYGAELHEWGKKRMTW